MRVLFVLSSRGAGGAEVLVRDLAAELRAKGVDVSIGFISRVADIGGSLEFESHYQAILDDASVGTFDLGHDCRRNPILGARRMLAVIKQFRPDVVHIHLQFGLLFRLLLWPRRIPTIYTHHIDRFRKGKVVFRLLALTVDHFVAISCQTEALLRAVAGNRVTRIVNAVRFANTSKPGARNKARSSYRILSVGALYPQKDYPTLIRTVASLVGARPDLAERLQVLIIGDGPERPRLEQLIQEANLGEIIELLGTRTDVHEMMAHSDLQLMTSDYEGLPITLIEAAHAGLPIVATDVGGCSEIVEHGRNGFLAPAGDDSALAKHIEALIDDPKLRKEFSRASLRVAQQFSITANADQHLALYQRVLERAGN